MKNELFEKINISIQAPEELVEKTRNRMNNQKQLRPFYFRSVALCILLTCLVTGTVIIANHTLINEPVIERITADYRIDVYNPRAVVGDVDYVFVGYVNEIKDTEYKFQLNNPYTNYSVTILENIKGNLVKNEPITIQKDGGISKDGDYILIFEDDYLPELGKLYIFTVYVQDDGCLLVSGPNSSIVLEDEINKMINLNEDSFGITTEVLNSSKIVSLYKDAFVNQIKTKRIKKSSILDMTSDESMTEISEVAIVDSTSK